jgi:hypothetical protein
MLNRATNGICAFPFEFLLNHRFGRARHWRHLQCLIELKLMFPLSSRRLRLACSSLIEPSFTTLTLAPFRGLATRTIRARSWYGSCFCFSSNPYFLAGSNSWCDAESHIFNIGNILALLNCNRIEVANEFAPITEIPLDHLEDIEGQLEENYLQSVLSLRRSDAKRPLFFLRFENFIGTLSWLKFDIHT